MTPAALLSAIADAEDMRDIEGVGNGIEALIRIRNATGVEVDLVTYLPHDDEGAATAAVLGALRGAGYTVVEWSSPPASVHATVRAPAGR